MLFHYFYLLLFSSGEQSNSIIYFSTICYFIQMNNFYLNQISLKKKKKVFTSRSVYPVSSLYYFSPLPFPSSFSLTLSFFVSFFLSLFLSFLCFLSCLESSLYQYQPDYISKKKFSLPFFLYLLLPLPLPSLSFYLCYYFVLVLEQKLSRRNNIAFQTKISLFYFFIYYLFLL